MNLITDNVISIFMCHIVFTYCSFCVFLHVSKPTRREAQLTGVDIFSFFMLSGDIYINDVDSFSHNISVYIYTDMCMQCT